MHHYLAGHSLTNAVTGSAFLMVAEAVVEPRKGQREITAPLKDHLPLDLVAAKEIDRVAGQIGWAAGLIGAALGFWGRRAVARGVGPGFVYGAFFLAEAGVSVVGGWGLALGCFADTCLIINYTLYTLTNTT